MIRIHFEDKAWTRFVTETGHNGRTDESYWAFLDFIALHNGKHVQSSPAIEFNTEEDAVMFRLKYGI